MKKRAIEEYYLGLDIGTNSVGYAVTDPQYKILKYHGEPMWGSHVFEEGSQCAERRGFRTARRRLNRRQQRVRFVQEIFAHEIGKVDSRFFLRIRESALYREDANGNDPFILFNDSGYTDKEYYLKYPTIHHLIMDLIDDENPHDVRLVYLAVAWLVAHRGHFLSDVEKTNVEKVLDFSTSYNALKEMYHGIGQDIPWIDEEELFKNILLRKCGVKDKEKAFKEELFKSNSIKNNSDKENEVLGASAVITLLSGGTVTADKLFVQAEFQDKISISFKKNEDEFEQILTELDEYAEYLLKIRAVYDWAVLYEASKGQVYISKAKIEVYEQHKKDLAGLKTFIRKYCPDKYNEIFRDAGDNNYVAYSYNFNSLNLDDGKKRPKRKASQEDFCTYIRKIVKDIKCEMEDKEFYDDMWQRLELGTFMPKQVNTDNRVIPYQLYYFELARLLEKVSAYLPFINEKDTDGYITKDKLLSIMEYRIPYYVGPLHKENSSFAWIERKAKGRIYPWNYEEKIDLDASEQAFINKMTNQCSYLPGEDVLPKYSLLYCKYEVLNEINNIKVNGQKVTVECKKGIFELFKRNKKVTVKNIRDFLISNNYMSDSDEITGLDISVKSSLKSYHDFRRMLENKVVNEEDVEEIIKRLTYTEDKKRINKYLEENYPNISEEDRRYISKLKYKDFGRLSEKFLAGIKGVVKETGEILSVIQIMWETNDNLMQIIFSDYYTIKDVLAKEREDYYSEHPSSVEQFLSDMYVSNAVKRPIYRTLDIIGDVTKACQNAPRKIFVEMARGGGEKGKRTVSRRDKIKELYKNMDKQEVREISKLLDEKTDNELQSEVLFLYFMQLGKCMYSGEPIDITKLKSDAYVNVDHIYPQAYVKDDSLNNKVLVKSKLNGEKSDIYPINKSIRDKMASTWKSYRKKGLISEEKYNRLTRKTPFTDEEKQGFVNRQLVETRQSTKAVAEILKMMFPETEVVYVKAGLASEFRHAFGIIKSRQINDLHHAKDAYLNVVCGNVYHSTFTKNFFLEHQTYSIKTETVYKKKIEVDGKLIWNGQESLSFVIKMLGKNNIHYTRYAFCRKGGFFDQMPVTAKEGLVSRKKDLPSEKYGGYNKPTASYFIMAKYTEKAKKEKQDIMIVPVELMVGEKVLNDEKFAVDYIRQQIAQISNKKVEEIVNVSFPLDLRPLKVNTRFSFDGFEACVTGKANGGKILGISSLIALKIDDKMEEYVKSIEKYIEKRKLNVNIKLDEKYDGINFKTNGIIYNLLKNKLECSVYNKMFDILVDVLEKGERIFRELSLEEQCVCINSLISIFKTGRSSGCDLTLIGGKKQAAVCTVSSKVSNWTKNYECVKIIDESASGIFRKESENILEWL